MINTILIIILIIFVWWALRNPQVVQQYIWVPPGQAKTGIQMVVPGPAVAGAPTDSNSAVNE